MAGFLALLFLLVLLALIVGIIKPRWVILWGDGDKTRKQVLKYYGLGLIATFILFASVLPDPNKKWKERFASHRDTIVASMQSDLNAGRYAAVLDTADQYLEVASGDSTLLALRRTAEEESLTVRLEDVPPSNYELNEELYGRLAEVDPSNQQYQKRQRYFSKRLAQQREEEQKQKQESESGGQENNSSLEEATFEQKLSIIEKGYKDPQTAKRFGSLLESLSSKYPESERQIGDMTARAYQTVTDKGFDASALAIMEGMNSLTAMNSREQNYSDHVATYMMLRTERGQSHEQAVENIRTLTQGFGNY